MDPISTLVGLVDTSAMVEFSSTASADKMKAELVQLMNKTNEVVAGLTVVASDLDTEEAAGAAIGVRVTAAEGDIDALQAAAVTLDAADRLAALETETNVGTITDEDNLTMAADLFKVILMAGTSVQVITLPDPNSGGFAGGQSWIITSDNLAGVRFAKSSDSVLVPYFGVASSADTVLMNGDTAILTIVVYGGSKYWSLSIARAGLDFAQASGVTFPYTIPTHIRSVMVQRAAHIGTKSIVLPRLDNDTNKILHGQEIMILLSGTPTSQTLVVSVNGSSTDVILGNGTGSSATSVTAVENSVLRFRAYCGAFYAWVLL